MLLDQWSVLFDRNVLLDGADGWEMQPVDGSVKTLWSHQPTATPPPSGWVYMPAHPIPPGPLDFLIKPSSSLLLPLKGPFLAFIP